MDIATQILGGVGLILLGMKLMTDGLKLAGGKMLKQVLRTWTKNGVRGIMSGFVITSLVQSSSAVTVAAIGFVNAGIMRLRQAVWVVYGSNVGTTTTAWIVAFVGLKVNVKAFALPMIAVGVAMWLFGGNGRKAPLGEALAGFGVFFLGVEVLQEIAPLVLGSFTFQGLVFQGMLGQLAFMAIGFGLTFVMQSSSAAMALVLTAAAGGLPMPTAAAAVIGANLGTTSTATLAVIGATSNAKRLALVHVVFNMLTAVVAFGLLRLILLGITKARMSLNMATDPATELALFHSCFNVLGILIMWPITAKLTEWVKHRFRTAEEDEGTPRYLDRTVLATPPLAVNALIMELGRISEVARRMAHTAVTCRPKPCKDMSIDRTIMGRLQGAVSKFTSDLSRQGLSQLSADSLPQVLRVAQYYTAAGEMAVEAEVFLEEMGRMENQDVVQEMDALLGIAATSITNADPEHETFSPARLGLFLDNFERSYQMFKDKLLQAGTWDDVDNETMVALLDRFSRIRRLIQQLNKGALLLYALRTNAIIQMRSEQ
ncbi:MAG: Na/Pi cotransporter family protein [Desulfovibrio sp.]|nr:MAG: Na/Pi cotransporter family protein [Desulfovibrio sp.]